MSGTTEPRSDHPCDLSIDACCSLGPCDPAKRSVCHRHARRAVRDPLAAGIDRALTGDHRLCALDPCSDCR